MKQFLDELRRRNVFRVGAAYLVGAWLLAQVGALLAETYSAPAWIMRSVVGVLAVGLPVALIFAWVYEMTPGGIVREDEGAPDLPSRQRASRSFDRALIALLTVALLYFVADKLWLSARTQEPNPSTTSASTVAVLPFENIGASPDNEVLADGIAETLLTMLMQVPQLQVMGRETSFSFKGRQTDPRAIALQLGVSAVLTGSVQRAAGRLRVSARLIDAKAGRQLWAESFDRTVDDVFAIQDEVARRVVQALKITLTGQTEPGLAGTHNFAAYELGLRAGNLVALRDASSVAKGIKLAEQAVALDPRYGDAWVTLAWGNLTSPSESDLSEALRAARKAVEVAPQAARSHLILSHALRIADQPRANEELAKALQLGPRDPAVLLVYAVHLRLRESQYAKSAEILRRIVLQDPRNAYMRQQLAMAYDATGDVRAALSEIRESIRLVPKSAFSHQMAAQVLGGVMGHRDDAIRFARKAISIDPLNDIAREQLAQDYAAIGMDDLSRSELATLAGHSTDDESLPVRAIVQPFWGDRSAGAALLARPITRESIEDGAIAELEELGVAPTRAEAETFLGKVSTLDPGWYDDAIAQRIFGPICLVARSGDRNRAQALLRVVERHWRDQGVAFMVFTDYWGMFTRPTSPWGRFDRYARRLACVGRTEAAIEELDHLMSTGYDAGGWRKLMTHPDYGPIRDEPRFKAIVSRLRATADAEHKRFLAKPDLTDNDIDRLGSTLSH